MPLALQWPLARGLLNRLAIAPIAALLIDTARC